MKKWHIFWKFELELVELTNKHILWSEFPKDFNWFILLQHSSKYFDRLYIYYSVIYQYYFIEFMVGIIFFIYVLASYIILLYSKLQTFRGKVHFVEMIQWCYRFFLCISDQLLVFSCFSLYFGYSLFYFISFNFRY